MPQVNFGKFATIGNKRVASGLASGLNSGELIDSMLKAREIPVQKLSDKIDLNNKKIEAFDKFHNLLSHFQTSCESLRKAHNFYTEDYEVFSMREISLTTNNGNDPFAYINLAATTNPEIGNHKISNIKIASPQTEVSESFTSKTDNLVATTPTKGMFTAGTFYINDLEVTIADGDSLLQIQSKINNLGNDSGVKATIVKSGYSKFELILQSRLAGHAHSFLIDDPFDVLSNIHFNIKNACNSSFILDDHFISRASNEVDDVLEGVIIQLRQNTPENLVINANIAPAIDNIAATIGDFVSNYNAIMLNYIEHNERDPKTQTYKADAILGGDSTLSILTNQIYDEVIGKVPGMDESELSRLSDIGISFSTLSGNEKFRFFKKFMNFNEALFRDKLHGNFNAVRKIFHFDYESTSPNFVVSERNNSIKLHDFTVMIADPEDKFVKIRYYDKASMSFINIEADYLKTGEKNGKITPKPGSLLDGISILYYGEGNETADISITHGIADRLYNLLKSASDSTSGVIYQSKTAISSSNTAIGEQMERHNNDIEHYRKKLVSQYAKVEDAVSKVNSVLQVLDAQDAARKASGN